MAHARGWTTISDEVIAQRRDNLAGNTSLFAEVHQSMFNVAQETSMAQQYTNKYLTFTIFDAPVHGSLGIYK
jgi:hypothetical protein